jgi:hypothetical protein
MRERAQKSQGFAMFTDGEWRVDGQMSARVDGHEHASEFISVSSEAYNAGGGVALVLFKGTWPERSHDNARLIANSKELFFACKALFDAPHQEHFAARMNDEEDAALTRIRSLVETISTPINNQTTPLAL